MPQILDNLLQLNLFDCPLDRVKFYTVASTRPDLVTKSGNLLPQVSVFTTLEKENKDSWEYEDFDYKLSLLGFRDKNLVDDADFDIDLAVFGCSYTFGIGLPQNAIWYNQLGSNLTTYNFGQPGASIKVIADIFHIVSSHMKIKKAVFLLPNYTRSMVAYNNPERQKDSDVEFVHLMPNMPRLSTLFEQYQDIHNIHYKYTSDAEFIRNMKDEVYLIEQMSKYKNIELFMSSWDEPTYQLLSRMNLRYANILKQFTWPTDPSAKVLARDKMHPGIAHHKYWANQIRNIVCK